MRKIPLTIAMVAVTAAMGAMLAGPTTAVPDKETVQCASSSKTYAEFKQCIAGAGENSQQQQQSGPIGTVRITADIAYCGCRDPVAGSTRR